MYVGLATLSDAESRVRLSFEPSIIPLELKWIPTPFPAHPPPCAPSLKTECDYLYGWIENKQTNKHRSHTQKSPKMVNPRHLAGNAEEEEEEEPRQRLATKRFRQACRWESGCGPSRGETGPNGMGSPPALASQGLHSKFFFPVHFPDCFSAYRFLILLLFYIVLLCCCFFFFFFYWVGRWGCRGGGGGGGAVVRFFSHCVSALPVHSPTFSSNILSHYHDRKPECDCLHGGVRPRTLNSQQDSQLGN